MLESHIFATMIPPPKLLLVTVAYNTPILIQYQIEYIKKYLQDEDYQLIVADNSTKDKYRKEIQKICEDNGIEYIPIPMYINRLHTSRGLSWSITWSSPQLVVLSCANCPQTKVFLVLSTTTSSLLLQHPFCNISRKA